jgi:hypothetical protein
MYTYLYYILQIMNCPKCDKHMNPIDGGVRVLTYTFCSPDCFRVYFTLAQLKQLYGIYKHNNKL